MLKQGRERHPDSHLRVPRPKDGHTVHAPPDLLPAPKDFEAGQAAGHQLPRPVNERKGDGIMKLNEWTVRWQAEYDSPNVRRSTYEAHRYVLQNHILPRLGDRELSKLTSKTVGQFLADCQAVGNHRGDKPLSQETMRHILSLLTKVLDQAVADGLMAENPAKAYSIKNTKQVKTTALSPWEVEAYLDAAEELGYLPFFTLALEYGLRQRELIALKWSDLDAKSRTLTIHMERSVECGELVEYGTQMRTLHLSEYAVEQLAQEHEKHPSSEAMFIHPGTLKPYSPNMARLLHKRVLEHAGLEHIRFEDLRHTSAVIALDAGQDVHAVSARLGHTRPARTKQNYREYLPQCREKKPVSATCELVVTDQQKAADKMASLLSI